MRGLKELRVKDRIGSPARGAAAGEWRESRHRGRRSLVHGTGRAPGGGLVITHMDHRLAMSALVMGLASEQPVQDR